MKKILLFALLGGYFIAGCKKGTDTTGTTNDTVSTQKVKLLTSETYTSSDYPTTVIPVNTYKYDSKHRIIEVISGSNTTEELTYDNNDRVIQVDTYSYNSLYSTYKYTYQTGSIAETGNIYSNGIAGTSFSVLLILDSNQRVVKTQSNISPSYFFTYDSQGNILSLGQNSIVDYNYTFDTHKNPFVNVKGNSYFFLNQWSVSFGNVNNLSSLSVPGDPTPSTYTYTFDPDGYPITQTTVVSSSGQPLITRTYQYTYSLL